MRWARSVDWSSTAGFHQRPTCTPWSARGGWRPGPPASRLTRNARHHPLGGTGLERCDHRVALPHRSAAVQELVGYAAAAEVVDEQARHRDVLGEDQDRTVLGEGGGDQLGGPVALLRE